MNKARREIIPVFFAVDDNYIPYLAVAIRSLIDNASDRFEYRIHVLIDELSEANKEILMSMQTENVTLEFNNVAFKLKSLCKRLHLRDYYTKATYYRFFVPEMFPEYRRGIYLDCDLVLNADVSELYSAISGRNLLAAIPDEIITDIDVFSVYSELVLGIPKYKYFNAGVLVMNLAEMRRMRIEERFAELLGERTYRVAQDQDYLNVLCRDRVTYLNKYWNKTPMPDSDESIIPEITHYKINYKPWKFDGVPYSEHFWKYAERTPFYEYLKDFKANYTDGERARDIAQYDGLVCIAEQEIEDAVCAELSIALCAEAI